jgi:DNA-binding Lrp family transcriptional regulator
MSAASSFSQTVFRLSPTELSSEITLKPEAWRLLAQINGARTLGEIAQTLGISEQAAHQIATGLLEARIIEAVTGVPQPTTRTVDVAFFDQLQHELTRAIGPVASIILEDALGALGESRERFPHERLAELVEHVSEQIRDPKRKLRFQQVMLDVMRKM